MTSGSLFRRDGTGWTGLPDTVEPNATSSNGTNSAVFRMTTRRRDFADVAISMDLKVNALSSTPTTPPVDWDGAHIFLRYQSETELYYASVARRDGHVVLKKKCTGGSSNGGTYYTLAEASGQPMTYGAWNRVGATVRTDNSGAVVLTLSRGGATVLTARDTGTGCAPIRSAGATGLRADNADLQFRNFAVTSTGS